MERLRWLRASLLVILLAAIGLAGTAAQAQDDIYVSILCSQYLRAEPSDDAARVGLMNPGERHQALGRNGWWVYIQVGDSLRGWSYDTVCLRVKGDFEQLPILNPEEAPLPIYSGPPVVRATCPQNVRIEPNLDGQRIGVIRPADGAISVVGRSADARWAYVQLPAGLRGWTYAGECVTVQGDLLSAPVQAENVSSGAPVAVIACEQNLREQPVLTSPVVRVIKPEDGPLPVEATTESAGWVYLVLPDGARGWTVNTGCVTVVGRPWDAPEYVDDLIPEETLAQLPADTTPFVQLLCTQYLRAAPSLTAESLAILAPADGPYTVTGRTESGGWLYVTNQQQAGWVGLSRCLSVVGDVTSRPVMTPTQAVDGAPIASLSCTQYLRAEPRNYAAALTILDGSEGPLAVTGRDASSGWLQIRLQDGTVGWAARGACVRVATEIASLTIVE